ncbi:MAG: recombinase-like helix-turn-helix domain-containing protein [Pseudonocardiaceae bacterium]
MTEQYLVEHQARATDPTPYEMKLAGAIEELFGSGRHDLPGLVAGLNDMGVLAPGGQRWTGESFAAEMKRLGARGR